MKSTIVSAANTVVPAYLALQTKGYTVYREQSSEPDREACWIAEDARRRFVAEDPVTLLGLVALLEARGDSWHASDEEIERFVSAFGSA